MSNLFNLVIGTLCQNVCAILQMIFFIQIFCFWFITESISFRVLSSAISAFRAFGNNALLFHCITLRKILRLVQIKFTIREMFTARGRLGWGLNSSIAFRSVYTFYDRRRGVSHSCHDNGQVRANIVRRNVATLSCPIVVSIRRSRAPFRRRPKCRSRSFHWWNTSAGSTSRFETCNRVGDYYIALLAQYRYLCRVSNMHSHAAKNCFCNLLDTFADRGPSGKSGPKDQVALHYYYTSPSHWFTTHEVSKL